VLTFVVATIFLLFLLSAAISAFNSIGVPNWLLGLFFFGSLLGSLVNIPIGSVKSEGYFVQSEYVSFFGIDIRVPQMKYRVLKTLVSVNVGGAVIPVIFSIYLLLRAPEALIIPAIIAIGIVSTISHAVARPIRGVGIATPGFIPPLTAATVAIILSAAFQTGVRATLSVFVLAYSSGVLGTLVGADLTNLGKLPQVGASSVSIGGAGTFDGVFMSGLIALILTLFFTT
jgi:uncharacterized membrane protein